MTMPASSSAPLHESRFQRARAALARLLTPGRRKRLRKSTSDAPTMLAILEAQQESTLDGILVVDSAGRVLTYNRRFLEIWGIPPEVASRADDNELLGYATALVTDWDAFIELVNYLYEHPTEVRQGDPVPLKDGRELTRATVPVAAADGKIMGRAWYFRDVTEARKADRLQAALFRIAQLSRESEDLDDFYAAVHQVVGQLMDATNFYI